MTKPITLITGSTSGIGKQIGIDLLAKGHYVIFMGRTQESSNELITELALKNISIKDYHIFQCYDMSNENSINEFITIIEAIFITIDNIILNVGITCRKNFDDISINEFNNVMNTNVIYPYYIVTQLSRMIQKRVIFIGSVLGHVPASSSIPYGVSKGSLEIMTKYLAKEFASKGVTVNTVAPGFTSTHWHASKSKEQIERIKKQILLGRFATTKEISHACQFIIENDYINAHTLCVDGGYHLG